MYVRLCHPSEIIEHAPKTPMMATPSVAVRTFLTPVSHMHRHNRLETDRPRKTSFSTSICQFGVGATRSIYHIQYYPHASLHSTHSIRGSYMLLNYHHIHLHRVHQYYMLLHCVYLALEPCPNLDLGQIEQYTGRLR